MANIMNMKDIKNNVHRSGFDKSQRNCFTAKVGEILPVMCEEVLPGDKWSINMREFMRTAPVQTASFGRVRQYYDFYFVPYNLLWDKFDAWIMQTKNAFHAKSILGAADDFTSHPYMLKDATGTNSYVRLVANMIAYPDNYYSDNGNAPGYNARKLLNYLGYPVYLSDHLPDGLAVNPFPLLAYQKIYQDYFRFSQWEDAAPWTYNLDYILNEDDLELDLSPLWNSIPDTPTMFTLRSCNLDKDYFNGLLPSPQYGDTAIAGPLSGSLPDDYSSTLQFRQANITWSAAATSTVRPVYAADTTGALGAENAYTLSIQNAQIQGVVDTGYSGFGQYSGLSVLLLRQAECLQKWKEITISGDTDFRTQLQKHWNVNISRDNSYMCQYLGGIASNLDISEVINNNLDSTDAKADIAGKGVSASNGHINFKSHQYGLIMCVYHAKPLIEWKAESCFPRLLTKTKATDYAIPEFDNIGMQSVQAFEFLLNYSSSDLTQPIGYAPRYIEYKTSYDRINGEFQNSLAPWVIPHSLSGSGLTSLTFKAFKVWYDVLDNMFGVNADENTDTDQFYCTAYFDAKVVRNLSRDGLPY